MAESAKNESPLNCHLQLKSPADEVPDIFQNKCNDFPTIMPQDVENVKVISAGVWLWTFVKDECGSWQYTVEPSEDAKVITWTLSDGEVPKKLYDSLKVVYQFSQKGKGCMANANLHFHKIDANGPVPNDYKAFILKMFQKVDEYLQNQKH